MSWDCTQLEERLSDYLEGCLTAEETAGADVHARACPRCAEWLEARQATLWLHQVEYLESPPGLETRILALTVAPQPEESFWAVLDRGWRALFDPRFALSLASALFTLALVAHAVDVPGRDLRAADFNPVNIYRTLDRQAHQAYAWGVRFVNDFRLVYEIRSRLEEPESEAGEPPAVAPSGQPAAPAPEKETKPSSSKGVRSSWLLACHHLGAMGEMMR